MIKKKMYRFIEIERRNISNIYFGNVLEKCIDITASKKKTKIASGVGYCMDETEEALFICLVMARQSLIASNSIFDICNSPQIWEPGDFSKLIG